MKRIIFTLVLALASAMSFTACTEEEIAPNAENGGAVFEEPVKR